MITQGILFDGGITSLQQVPADRFISKKETKLPSLLLKHGNYLVRTSNVNGCTIYKVYDESNTPQRYFRERQVQTFLKLCKQDRKERITLNLNLVRQLHGNTQIKKLYKKYRRHGK